jgi:hypothetical protein
MKHAASMAEYVVQLLEGCTGPEPSQHGMSTEDERLASRMSKVGPAMMMWDHAKHQRAFYNLNGLQTAAHRIVVVQHDRQQLSMTTPWFSLYRVASFCLDCYSRGAVAYLVTVRLFPAKNGAICNVVEMLGPEGAGPTFHFRCCVLMLATG